jgi:hypothetical protein
MQERGELATTGQTTSCDSVSHLKDFGVTRKQSSRWQRMAAVQQHL